MTYSPLIKLIHRHENQNPNGIAVTFLNQTITYSELMKRSDQLACHLINLGVQPGMLVGIYLERSLEIFVAILAILKAGAAYVPIDPNYPCDRIRNIVKESHINTLLTQKSLHLNLNGNSLSAIYIDCDWPTISECKPDQNSFPSKTDFPAYVLFTSGSTGKPKGVIINQSNLLNAYFAWEKAYCLTPKDVHLQMASYSFDVFSGDFIRALCSGGRIVLCPRQILLDPIILFNLIQQEKVTCAEFVPTVLRKFMEYLSANQLNLNFMRLVICGSDNWTIGEYKKFKQLCDKNTRLINSYGLTEATIDSTYFEIVDGLGSLSDEDSVPIGKPFSGTEIYLLDEEMNMTLKGKVGEIYIAGNGLAGGYLNQPELTRSRFMDHELDGRKIHLYKTGDLARMLPDGNIQLMGRSDNQTKLHGHRIELTDIENNLNQHPFVYESLVAVQVDENNHKLLVAYVILKQGHDVSSKALREFLKVHLPVYMVPRVFIKVDELPLTPNGKVDRQFFKARQLTFENFKPFIDPQDKVEKIIIRKLRSYLMIGEICTQDTFCDLGMDSLMLSIFFQEIIKKFDLDIEPSQLLEFSTVEKLAKFIKNENDKCNAVSQQSLIYAHEGNLDKMIT